MERRDDVPAARESLEEADAIAGAAEEALEADEGFLAVRIRRAREWQEELRRRAEAASHA